ncbi:MAG: hypothetical protein HGA36_02960 [Candidatus Moranbacteria bacterium]|nr:hypothetical protein [Candidatus Moranbacteria bacterium]
MNFKFSQENYVQMKATVEKIKSFLGSKKILWLILGIIIAVGIFLRTYHFHDWLRFNMDQGRDAVLISNVVDGSTPIPLIGPKAGGTEFKLGPMPYYFQIISAKLFGNFPDKMAYPDLISSILCIPLLFFFLQKYFTGSLSIALTGLFSLSFYAVLYSRFAWNPNSTPFWTILGLYGIHNIISQKNPHKIFWATITGIAIGVGVQLHTTLLLFFPIITILIFGFLLYQKINLLKYFFIILVISLFLNIPQFINEYKTNGQNIQRFFTGVQMKQDPTKTFIDKTLRNTSCWAGSNVVILSGYELFNSCQINSETDFFDITIFALGVIFLFGGTYLGIRYLKQEQDLDKKYFLAIIFLYIGIAYLTYLPLAYSIDMRFFLMFIFFPLILLGFWTKFLMEKIPKNIAHLSLIPIILLVASNLFFIKNSFADFADFEEGRESKNVLSNVMLKEIECVSNFIIENSSAEKELYISGNKQYLRKSINSINFFVSRSNLKLIVFDESKETKEDAFYLRSSNKRKQILKESNTPIRYDTCGRMLIYRSIQQQ